VRPIVSFLMPRIGPRGLEFARTRIEMKAAETVIHLRRAYPQRIKNMVPAHVWRLLAPYGYAPQPHERRGGTSDAPARAAGATAPGTAGEDASA